MSFKPNELEKTQVLPHKNSKAKKSRKDQMEELDNTRKDQGIIKEDK